MSSGIQTLLVAIEHRSEGMFDVPGILPGIE